MSGTSLDGLDLAECSFTSENNTWKFEILKTSHRPYPEEILEQLKNATKLQDSAINNLDSILGKFYAKACLKFNLDDIDFIASHGHTIFHQPEKKMTLQIGNLAEMNRMTDKKVIGDFRSLDVSLGGQGAPLVPIGDRMLFSDYTACVNLGGFSNISMEKSNQRIAWDICPVNVVSNRLAQALGREFDRDGELAKSGLVDSSVLNALNQLNYYKLEAPKSLGMEWVLQHVQPIIDASPLSVEDKLSTWSEHIAIQIAKELPSTGKTLFTGGGSRNKFLMEKIRNKTTAEIVIPTDDLLDFKEAMIFAFLGVLRIRGEINTLSSVTGAERDSSGGVIVG